MNLAFNYHAGPTEIGTLTDFLAANITLARCYNPQDQYNLYQANKHHYWVHSNLLGSKTTWFLNNYTNDSNTFADLKKVTKLTRKVTKSVYRSVCFTFWWSSMLLERNLCFSIQLSVMIYFEIWVTVKRVVLNRSLCQFITMLLHPHEKKSLSTYLKIHWTSLKLRCMHTFLGCLWLVGNRNN